MRERVEALGGRLRPAQRVTEENHRIAAELT
jgi:hypothetical protein